MTTYKVKFVSQPHAIMFVIVFLTAIIGGNLLFNEHGTGNTAKSIMIVLFTSVVTYFAWQRFVTGRTEWTIDNNGISIIWTRRFPFSELPDLKLKWNEIERISRGPDPNYYTLKMLLRDGDTIKFFHDSLTTRDDFEALLKVLYDKFDDKNTGRDDSVRIV